MQKRKRGGQPGNKNAWKHGHFSKVMSTERRAAWESERERSRAWAAKMPATDYAAICAAMEASGATKH